MAKITIEVDTANKSQAKVTIDGKVIKNIDNVSLYGVGTEYMSIDIGQFEIIGEGDGAMRKYTRLSASEKDSPDLSNFASASAPDKEISAGIAALLKLNRRK